MWKYFTDLFDYLPLTALVDGQVCNNINLRHLKIQFACIFDVLILSRMRVTALA